MQPKKKILVTGAGALLGQGIIRSLLELPQSYDVVACDPSSLSAGLYWTKSRHIIPFANDEKWLPAFSSILEREQPDAVLVGTDVELHLLAHNRADIERRFNTRVVVSSPSVVAIADDKWRTYEFLKTHGFEAPDSCLPGNEKSLIDRVGFPLVVKPRVGARSVGVRIVRNAVELKNAIDVTNAAVVQECVATEHDEYTAGAVCVDGRCQASIVMRRDLRDGNTYRAWVDRYPDLNEFVRRVTEALQPDGPVNFQFRLPKTGPPKIFEINARFSGTTPLRMRAGFNEVDMVLRRVLLGEPIVQPLVRPMLILRHLSETVVLPDEYQ